MNKKLLALALSPIPVLLLAAIFFTGCPHDAGPENPGAGIPAPSVIRGNGVLSVGWAAKTGLEYEVWYGTSDNANNAAKWTGAVTKIFPVAATVINGLNNNQTYYVWIKVHEGGVVDFGPGTGGTPEAVPTPPEGFAYVPGGTVAGSNSYAMVVTVPAVSGYMNAGKTLTKKGVFVEGRKNPLDSFFMAKHLTTRQLWHEVQSWAESSGYFFENNIIAPDEADNNKPVSGISWRDAIVWCNAYSEMSGLEPVYHSQAETVLRDSRNANGAACDGARMDTGKNGFRLPTEAEREYAARGGDPGKADWMFLYAGSSDADEVAWHHGNSAYQIKDVGQKKANRLGIYDLSGNVQEWGWDWMNYSIAVTPQTPVHGEQYTSRFSQKSMAGGGVGSNITMSCVADRWGYGTNYTDPYVGFRLVRRVQ